MVKGNYIQARQLKILERCHDHLDTTIVDMSALRRYCANKCTDTKNMFHAKRADDNINHKRLHRQNECSHLYTINANFDMYFHMYMLTYCLRVCEKWGILIFEM